MQNIIYEFHQVNMYCNMCLINVVGVLSHMNNVTEFSVDLNTRQIRVVFGSNAPEKNEIRTIINQALTRGVTS